MLDSRTHALATLWVGIAAAAASAAPEDARIEKLWESTVRPEGSPIIAGNVVLVPCGIEVVALELPTGRETWRSRFVEERGGIAVPARVQGLGSTLLRPDRGMAIVIGSQEIHGLAPSNGRTLWKHQERTWCTLAMSLAGDFDGDGVRDAVVSGCNSVVCVSSASGAALWEYPISGRSWWTADAGDLDGDGRGEVLVYASGAVHAVRGAEGRGVVRIWSVAASLQPLLARPQPRSVVLVYPTGAIERRSGADGAVAWQATGTGGKVADARLSADGRDLLLLGGGSVARVRLGDGALETLAGSEARAGAFLPGGRQAILAFDDGSVGLFDVSTRVAGARTKIAGAAIETVIPSDAGRVIVSTGRHVMALRLPEETKKP